MMDHSWGKFGDCSFSRFGFFLADRPTTYTDTQTNADERYTPATLVDVSNERIFGLTPKITNTLRQNMP